MHHIKVGGVCLLAILIAAALPVGVLGQGPEAASSSPSESDNAESGASSIISQSLASKSTQEETISAESVARSNKGLKPLGSTGQTAASQSPAASDQAASTTPFPSAEEAEAAAPETQTTQAADDAAISDETTEILDAAKEEQTVTPDEIETTETAPSVEETEMQQTEDATSATVTPPEDEPLGTAVSPITDVAPSNESEDASLNETENVTEEEEIEEDETVDEKPANRIWREGDPEDYTWNWKSFSGFFYDMEKDVGTETLNINLGSDRSADSGSLKYETRPANLDFKFGDWGDYQVIGFMAEKYFAGYLASDILDEDYSFLDEGQLRRVLVDNDDSQTLSSGSALTLEEGYELQIKQIDIDGEKVYLGLYKDGEEIDSKVISPEGSIKSSTYQYEEEISGEDVPIVMAHIQSVFASAESDLVTVDGLFQISDTYASVEDGDEYGKMKVESVSQDGVTMENEDSINLKRGGKINIFGEVGFIVADDDVLRFAPIVDRTGPQDVRGTVINPSKEEEFTWNVYNFEGFYYDIDEDVGTEELTATIKDGKSIEEGDLVYSTKPMPVDFELATWGKYDVIGFMADKYFAGYNNRTEFTDEFSVIGESELRKVLVDSDESQTLAAGSVLPLEEGYELRIKSVDLNGEKVYLALTKDGEEVDSKVVTPSSDAGDTSSNYLYKIDMGSEDVPLVAAHIDNVFRSTETDMATVDGIFQISDSPQSVENGEVHGKMEVEDTSSDGITMENDGSFSLQRDKTIEIMDNLRFVVADSSDRLFAPVAFKPGEGMDLTLSVPDAVVNNPVTISVKSGTTALAGVQILMNGSSIGTTSVAGSIIYTPTSVGVFQIVAKKKDYNDGKASLTVRTASETAKLSAYEQANETLSYQLAINAPLDVVKGENFLITVVEGINQTPVEGANISLDDESLGLTGSQGTMTYSANVTGEHTLKAEKEGFKSATKSISIGSSLKVVELNVPETAYAGSEMKISATVQNEGSREDTLQFDLLANETVVESKNATVKSGENSTIIFTYEPEEPGLTEIRVDDLRKSVNVEKAKSNWLVALILVLLIAIGAGYYLYRTGELDSLQRQVQKMMKGR